MGVFDDEWGDHEHEPPVGAATVLTAVRPLDRHPFTYLLPDDDDVRVDVGSLVRVPLHGRSVRGWVLGLVPVDAVDPDLAERLLPVRLVLGGLPVANRTTLQLALWAADEYAGTAAAVLSWATPEPLPHGARRRFGRDPETTARIPGLSARIAAGEPFEAFIRTWPSDDTAATVGPLVASLPPDRAALVVSPPASAPRVPNATVLAGRTGAPHTRAWEEAVGGDARVVVAGRRGPLVPIPNLGLVVVTHEHRGVHKDQQTPALDARVLGRRLTALAEVPYVAIGPTSPIGPEGVLAAAAAEGRDVEATTVPGAVGRWPAVEIASLTDEPPGSGALSDRFFATVRATLERNGRVLAFLNRKGSARALVCRACNAMAACDRCDGLLRVERSDGDRLVCRSRSCDRVLDFVACPACGSRQVRQLGIGVDRMRSEIAKAFPGTAVVVAKGEDAPVPRPGSIVVGTQVAFRHRETFDLTVLVDPDAMLAQPGLRAEEAAFSLLIDAVGTARRRHDGGLVLVQTRRPDDPAMRALAARDPAVFEDAQLAKRATLDLPPWRRILAVSSQEPEPVASIAEALGRSGADILGPTDKPRPHALALADPTQWHTVTETAAAARAEFEGVRVRVEADPLDT